jgi:hypothetical protein
MKYQNWDTYTDEMKQKAAEAESLLDTHNGTTKDDLINIMCYLHKENDRLRRICASYENGELPKAER